MYLHFLYCKEMVVVGIVKVYQASRNSAVFAAGARVCYFDAVTNHLKLRLIELHQGVCCRVRQELR